ncbi:MAG TPA: zinc ribbon domain-containing protein [Candidatus Binatia bacterium]|nr:zinc ribbon domain-containing protein [Candidatus Binatia bacterium]
MPIYEYACPKCGEFELSQSIKDAPLSRCPKCRSKVTKLISSAAFQLKGGGWYSDGYQKKGSSKTSDSPAATSTDSGSKSESVTPAKSTTTSSD